MVPQQRYLLVSRYQWVVCYSSASDWLLTTTLYSILLNSLVGYSMWGGLSGTTGGRKRGFGADVSFAYHWEDVISSISDSSSPPLTQQILKIEMVLVSFVFLFCCNNYHIATLSYSLPAFINCTGEWSSRSFWTYWLGCSRRTSNLSSNEGSQRRMPWRWRVGKMWLWYSFRVVVEICTRRWRWMGCGTFFLLAVAQVWAIWGCWNQLWRPLPVAGSNERDVSGSYVRVLHCILHARWRVL